MSKDFENPTCDVKNSGNGALQNASGQNVLYKKLDPKVKKAGHKTVEFLLP